MKQSEDQKKRRREREKLAREYLSLSYVRKLVKAKWDRKGIPIASEEIPSALLQAEQAVLVAKRMSLGRPVVLPEWMESSDAKASRKRRKDT
jgi:hypothetical protein